MGGGGRWSDGSTVLTDSGVAWPLRAATAMAAPKEMASFGWASMAMGRPSSAATICATSGMRDEPPTSSTALMSSSATLAERMARRSAVIVSLTAGRTMLSNSLRVRRTSVCRLGSSTGIDTSVSLESASLASMHSWRRRAMAASAEASSGSSWSRASPTASRTWATTASSKSMPPRRSMPSGVPIDSNPLAVRRTIAASNVPPPRSYTATTAPGSRRRCDA